MFTNEKVLKWLTLSPPIALTDLHFAILLLIFDIWRYGAQYNAQISKLKSSWSDQCGAEPFEQSSLEQLALKGLKPMMLTLIIIIQYLYTTLESYKEYRDAITFLWQQVLWLVTSWEILHSLVAYRRQPGFVLTFQNRYPWLSRAIDQMARLSRTLVMRFTGFPGVVIACRCL